ncbi:MAG: FMN-dependent NADH-azoreductase [Endozoicomonas sp.]
MKTLLQIDSSLFGDAGQSSRLTRQFVEKYLDQHPGTTIIRRDLAANPVPHLNAETFQGFMLQDSERNNLQKEVADLSDSLIKELQQADVLVLGLPMYNFSLPSTLKSWFDHIARAGITFRYTENGPEGLLKGKKACVLAARGGAYQGTPMDTQTDLVRQLLKFIGIEDVEFVYAEGLAMGDGQKEQGLAQASEHIDRLVA